LVEWAKQQQEKTRFNPKKIHLLKKVNNSLELLRVNAVQKEITLEYEIPYDIYVHADATMLRSILQNLAANAIQFTPQGGSVHITAQMLETTVEICVKDSGIGMTSEVKERLFSKVSSSSILGTNKEQGSGLGLLLVRDFIAQHGGSINVESETGKGTCFTFTIPGELNEHQY